ncbi:uncharacterized protein [Drosophila tropicalis]|uniref:uncharacterized protein n=1 Tax=Drosophila tropicalis TaxID=46794 RepID=UPI0035AB84CA
MLEKISLSDQNGDFWVTWATPRQLKDFQSGSLCVFDGHWIVAFHYFQQHAVELNKWIKLLEKLAEEYEDRIHIAMRDIHSIQNFSSALDPADFGSYRSDVPPRVLGMEHDKRIYVFHMLFNQKYLKDFCDKLLGGQMFQAELLEPPPIVSKPRNFYDLEDEKETDYLIMLYDPACYYWPQQLGILRKLTKLLANEKIRIVLIDKSKNYLGVQFTAWYGWDRCYGCVGFASWRKSAMHFNFSGRKESTRDYLKLICKNIQPELKGYDAEGELRAPEQALNDIRFLFTTNQDKV